MNILKLFKKKEEPKREYTVLDGLKSGSNRLRSTVMPSEFDSAFKGWAGICVKLRADAISSLDWQVKVNGNPMEKHWLIDLINKPNSYITKRDFLALISQYLDATGNFYAVVDKSEIMKNLPLAIHVLPSARVTQVYDGMNIIGYDVQGTQIKHYLPEQILHIKNITAGLTFDNQLIGKSTISSAMDSIKSGVAMNSFLLRYFDNDGIPPLIAETDNILSEEAFRLWRTEFEQIFGREITGLVQNGMKVKPLSDNSLGSNSNLIPELDKIFKTNIAAAFGVPPSKLTSEYQNRATAQISDNAFRKDTIEPLAYSIEAQITNYFNQFEEGLEFSHIPYIDSDDELEMKKQEHRLSLGLTNRNEEREEMSLGKLQDGEKYLLKTSLQFTDNMKALPNAVASEKPKEPIVPAKTFELENTKKKGFKVKIADMNEQEKQLVWKSWNSIATKFEPQLETITKTMFDDITNDMIKRLDKVSLKSMVVSTKKEEPSKLTLEQLFDVDEWNKKLGDYYDDNLKSLILENMEFAFKSLGENWEGTTSEMDKKVKNATQKSLDRISTSLETINEETKKSVSKLITDNYDLDKNKLKELIKANLLTDNETRKNSRASAIAETTATFVRGASQEEAWDGLDVDKLWLSRRDNAVRDSHQKVDGQKADEEGFFTVGSDKMQFPAMGSTAKENVRCRCVAIAELRD